MKLKEGIDMSVFMEAAKECTGEIFFHSAEGDIINLKSLISQYVLASIIRRPGLLDDGQIVCTQDEDYQKLADFLQQ